MSKGPHYRRRAASALVAAALFASALPTSAPAQMAAPSNQEPSVTAKSTVAVVGNVTMVEASYLPARVAFLLDAGGPAGRCPAGTILSWQWSDAEKVKGGLSLLMAALTASRPVAVFFNASTTDCNVQFLHLRATP